VTGLREWWFVSFNEGTEPFTHLQTWDEYTDKVADALDEFVTKYAPIRSQVLHKLTKKQNAPRRRRKAVA
jgi:hypothetical protein